MGICGESERKKGKRSKKNKENSEFYEDGTIEGFDKQKDKKK